MIVSIHLKKPHYQEFDILTANQSLESGMEWVSRGDADKLVIKDNDRRGSLILNADGTWAYHSADIVLHKENLR